MKTNLMHYLSSVYFISQPVHFSGIFVAHHQEVYCIYTTTSTCCAFWLSVGQKTVNWKLKLVFITLMYQDAQSTKHKIQFLCCQPCVIHTDKVVDTDSSVFIVLEFMEGGDLSRRVRPGNPLQESHIKLIFFQLVQAIQYLHQQKIVHRDIKVGPYMFHTKYLNLNLLIILVLWILAYRISIQTSVSWVLVRVVESVWLENAATSHKLCRILSSWWW